MAIQFAYKVFADLSKAQPEIVLFNATQWADAGAPLTDGLQFFFTLTTPSGIVLQDDTTPAITGLDWTSYTFPVVIPQVNGHMEWGSNGYKISGYCKAPDSTSPTISVELPLCPPKGNGANQTDNYGAMRLDVQVRCAEAMLQLQEKSDYTYLGYPGTVVTTLLRLIRPADDPLTPPATYDRSAAFSLLAIPLFKDGEGYQLLAEMVRDYVLSEVVTLRLKYKYRKTFNVRCYVDLCGIIKGLDKYADDLRCNRNVQGSEQKLLLLHHDVSLLMMVRAQPLCGIGIQPFVDRIIKGLGAYYQPCDKDGGLYPSIVLPPPPPVA